MNASSYPPNVMGIQVTNWGDRLNTDPKVQFLITITNDRTFGGTNVAPQTGFTYSFSPAIDEVVVVSTEKNFEEPKRDKS